MVVGTSAQLSSQQLQLVADLFIKAEDSIKGNMNIIQGPNLDFLLYKHLRPIYT